MGVQERTAILQLPDGERIGAILGRAVTLLQHRSPHKVWEHVDDERATWEEVGSRVAGGEQLSLLCGVKLQSGEKMTNLYFVLDSGLNVTTLNPKLGLVLRRDCISDERPASCGETDRRRLQVTGQPRNVSQKGTKGG